MKTTLNRAMFEVTSFDSAAPAGAAAVVHQFKEAGQFAVTLHREDRIVDTRALAVEEVTARKAAAGSTAATSSTSTRAPDGVVVDTSDRQPQPGRPTPPRQPSSIRMSAGGYASFTAAPGKGNRAVVRLAGSDDQEVAFDTQQLGSEDVFALTLVRPGTYVVRDTIQGTEGSIVVTYPVIGDKPYRPGDPVVVRAQAAGFSPPSVTLGPGQGLIIRVDDASRITVDLQKPDDGPHGSPTPRPKGQWGRTRPANMS